MAIQTDEVEAGDILCQCPEDQSSSGSGLIASAGAKTIAGGISGPNNLGGISTFNVTGGRWVNETNAGGSFLNPRVQKILLLIVLQGVDATSPLTLH